MSNDLPAEDMKISSTSEVSKPIETNDSMSRKLGRPLGKMNRRVRVRFGTNRHLTKLKRYQRILKKQQEIDQVSKTHMNEWPFYSKKAINFALACELVMGDSPVPNELICTSTPQKCSTEATFVVDLSQFKNRHQIALDGWGVWSKPQGSFRYNQTVGDGERKKVDIGTAHNMKVLCNRYQHPGTDENRGCFYRKIYTCYVDSNPTSLAVLTYEWTGQPHDIHALSSSTQVSTIPIAVRSLESKETSPFEHEDWNGLPIYSRVAMDFNTAVKLILKSVIVPDDRVCHSIPQGYRLNGTFVVFLNSFLDEIELRKDGNGKWSKPSGCSRYYKIENEYGNVRRVDRNRQMAFDVDYDVQVLNKRYENEEPGSQGRFVRKIYLGKNRDTFCNLAVITYFWKGEPFICPLFTQQGDPSSSSTPTPKSRKNLFNSSCVYIESPAANITLNEDNSHCSSLDGLILGHVDHLKRLTLAKELDNQNRLSILLSRAEQFLDRFERIPH